MLLKIQHCGLLPSGKYKNMLCLKSFELFQQNFRLMTHNYQARARARARVSRPTRPTNPSPTRLRTRASGCG